MEKGNILVIGNSGVGKSTLINAVLGEKKAAAGFGIEGTSKEIRIYEPEDEAIPLRLIDTVGFEPSRRLFEFTPKAVKSVQEWSKAMAADGKPDSDVNIIWFCVDGCTAKLFPETVKSLLRATSIWKSVPIIAVITKSYSVPDRAKNVEMVRQAFAAASKTVTPRAIIPVVADPYYLTETAFAAPENISELIETTVRLLPEGIRASQEDVAAFVLERKRSQAQAVVLGSTIAASVVGAVPIPFADAAILGPVEVGEISGIAAIYGFAKDEQIKLLKNTIVEVGTVSGAAKGLISALKAIPGLNLAAGVINAVTAGGIVAALGEGSIFVFEQIYQGNRDVSDIDWVKKVIESRLSNQVIDGLKKILDNKADQVDLKGIADQVYRMVAEMVGRG